MKYTKSEIKKEVASVAYNYGKYGFHVDEYFLYDVKGLSNIGKKRFITEETRWNYYSRLNKNENLSLFDNKEQTYELFKKYYKREIIAIRSLSEHEKFQKFLLDHDKVILKPCNGSGGKGVRTYQSTDTLSALLVEYKSGFIMEPIISNIEEISEFNKDSLNTIRIVTVRLNNRTEIAFACLRIGQEGSCVDNGAAGGIICSIELENGKIYAAIDERGNKYIEHPTSKKTILGYQIPQWAGLKEFVKELAQIIPSNRYTAWDVALTDNGWLLIEANARGQFIGQMPAREGLKSKFDSYISELERNN